MRKLLLLVISCFFLFAFSIVNATPTKTWTFLVYLNGDNNLDGFGEENIRAMEKVGSNDQVNIVVQWASESARKTVRLLVRKSTDASRVTSPIIQDMGLVDMGDYHNLQDFIQWGVTNYPADHYFVDVWNHGSGWHAVKPSAALHSSHLFGDISWDDNSGHSISTEQLGQVMTFAARIIGHKVDLYGSDACLMAMAEVANEMIGSVDFFAGSQETEPGAGWPYAELLSKWQATPNETPDQVAKILTDVYVKSYQGGSNGRSDVTFSAFDLNKLSGFNRAMTNLGVSLRRLNAADRAKVVKLAAKTQSFAYRDYGDVLDFVGKLSTAGLSGVSSTVITDVQAAASQLIIANSVTPRYARAKGLSIWLPSDRWSFDKNSQRYLRMSFNAGTQWGDTLTYLLQDLQGSSLQ